jgi:hypothetical protein
MGRGKNSEKTSPKQKHATSNIKRQRESPDNNSTSNKKVKEAMTKENATLEAILQKVNKLDSIEEKLCNLEVKIDLITQDLQAHKNDTALKINNLQAQIDGLKTQNNILSGRASQDQLKLDVMCFGLPSTYQDKADDVIDTFNRYFDLSLSRTSFTKILIAPSKNPQTSMRMSFIDMRDKQNFMSAVYMMSKESDNTLHPLMVEDIFEELKNPPNLLCGKTINFANSLTRANQEIIRMRKTIKPYILQERNGRIFIKKNKQSRSFEVHSTSQVREYVAEFSKMHH